MKRNIVLSVILMFITFGIYGIYWFVKVNNEANEMAKGDYQTSGGKAFLFSIITLGIYALYWCYKQGENYDLINGKKNSDSSLLFLIIGLISGNLIPLILLQGAINKSLEDSSATY